MIRYLHIIWLKSYEGFVSVNVIFRENIFQSSKWYRVWNSKTPSPIFCIDLPIAFVERPISFRTFICLNYSTILFLLNRDMAIWPPFLLWMFRSCTLGGALGWWLAPLPFTPEFGVRFPVSAVWKKHKCFFPIHVWKSLLWGASVTER